MNEMVAEQLVIDKSKIKSTLIIVLMLGILNIGTDLTVGLVPGVGDVANSIIDTILMVLQLGAIVYLKSNGMDYISTE